VRLLNSKIKTIDPNIVIKMDEARSKVESSKSKAGAEGQTLSAMSQALRSSYADIAFGRQSPLPSNPNEEESSTASNYVQLSSGRARAEVLEEVTNKDNNTNLVEPTAVIPSQISSQNESSLPPPPSSIPLSSQTYKRYQERKFEHDVTDRHSSAPKPPPRRKPPMLMMGDQKRPSRSSGRQSAFNKSLDTGRPASASPARKRKDVYDETVSLREPPPPRPSSTLPPSKKEHLSSSNLRSESPMWTSEGRCPSYAEVFFGQGTSSMISLNNDDSVMKDGSDGEVEELPFDPPAAIATTPPEISVKTCDDESFDPSLPIQDSKSVEPLSSAEQAAVQSESRATKAQDDSDILFRHPTIPGLILKKETDSFLSPSLRKRNKHRASRSRSKTNENKPPGESEEGWEDIEFQIPEPEPVVALSDHRPRPPKRKKQIKRPATPNKPKSDGELVDSEVEQIVSLQETSAVDNKSISKPPVTVELPQEGKNKEELVSKSKDQAIGDTGDKSSDEDIEMSTASDTSKLKRKKKKVKKPKAEDEIAKALREIEMEEQRHKATKLETPMAETPSVPVPSPRSQRKAKGDKGKVTNESELSGATAADVKKPTKSDDINKKPSSKDTKPSEKPQTKPVKEEIKTKIKKDDSSHSIVVEHVSSLSQDLLDTYAKLDTQKPGEEKAQKKEETPFSSLPPTNTTEPPKPSKRKNKQGKKTSESEKEATDSGAPSLSEISKPKQSEQEKSEKKQEVDKEEILPTKTQGSVAQSDVSQGGEKDEKKPKRKGRKSNKSESEDKSVTEDKPESDKAGRTDVAESKQPEENKKEKSTVEKIETKESPNKPQENATSSSKTSDRQITNASEEVKGDKKAGKSKRKSKKSESEGENATSISTSEPTVSKPAEEVSNVKSKETSQTESKPEEKKSTGVSLVGGDDWMSLLDDDNIPTFDDEEELKTTEETLSQSSAAAAAVVSPQVKSEKGGKQTKRKSKKSESEPESVPTTKPSAEAQIVSGDKDKTPEQSTKNEKSRRKSKKSESESEPVKSPEVKVKTPDAQEQKKEESKPTGVSLSGGDDWMSILDDDNIPVFDEDDEGTAAPTSVPVVEQSPVEAQKEKSGKTRRKSKKSESEDTTKQVTGPEDSKPVGSAPTRVPVPIEDVENNSSSSSTNQSNKKSRRKSNKSESEDQSQSAPDVSVTAPVQPIIPSMESTSKNVQQAQPEQVKQEQSSKKGRRKSNKSESEDQPNKVIPENKPVEEVAKAETVVAQSTENLPKRGKPDSKRTRRKSKKSESEDQLSSNNELVSAPVETVKTETIPLKAVQAETVSLKDEPAKPDQPTKQKQRRKSKKSESEDVLAVAFKASEITTPVETPKPKQAPIEIVSASKSDQVKSDQHSKKQRRKSNKSESEKDTPVKPIETGPVSAPAPVPAEEEIKPQTKSTQDTKPEIKEEIKKPAGVSLSGGDDWMSILDDDNIPTFDDEEDQEPTKPPGPVADQTKEVSKPSGKGDKEGGKNKRKSKKSESEEAKAEAPKVPAKDTEKDDSQIKGKPRRKSKKSECENEPVQIPQPQPSVESSKTEAKLPEPEPVKSDVSEGKKATGISLSGGDDWMSLLDDDNIPTFDDEEIPEKLAEPEKTEEKEVSVPAVTDKPGKSKGKRKSKKSESETVEITAKAPESHPVEQQQPSRSDESVAEKVSPPDTLGNKGKAKRNSRKSESESVELASGSSESTKVASLSETSVQPGKAGAIQDTKIASVEAQKSNQTPKSKRKSKKSESEVVETVSTASELKSAVPTSSEAVVATSSTDSKAKETPKVEDKKAGISLVGGDDWMSLLDDDSIPTFDDEEDQKPSKPFEEVVPAPVKVPQVTETEKEIPAQDEDESGKPVKPLRRRDAKKNIKRPAFVLQSSESYEEAVLISALQTSQPIATAAETVLPKDEPAVAAPTIPERKGSRRKGKSEGDSQSPPEVPKRKDKPSKELKKQTSLPMEPERLVESKTPLVSSVGTVESAAASSESANTSVTVSESAKESSPSDDSSTKKKTKRKKKKSESEGDSKPEVSVVPPTGAPAEIPKELSTGLLDASVQPNPEKKVPDDSLQSSSTPKPSATDGVKDEAKSTTESNTKKESVVEAPKPSFGLKCDDNFGDTWMNDDIYCPIEDEDEPAVPSTASKPQAAVVPKVAETVSASKSKAKQSPIVKPAEVSTLLQSDDDVDLTCVAPSDEFVASQQLLSLQLMQQQQAMAAAVAAASGSEKESSPVDTKGVTDGRKNKKPRSRGGGGNGGKSLVKKGSSEDSNEERRVRFAEQAEVVDLSANKDSSNNKEVKDTVRSESPGLTSDDNSQSTPVNKQRKKKKKPASTKGSSSEVGLAQSPLMGDYELHTTTSSGRSDSPGEHLSEGDDEFQVVKGKKRKPRVKEVVDDDSDLPPLEPIEPSSSSSDGQVLTTTTTAKESSSGTEKSRRDSTESWTHLGEDDIPVLTSTTKDLESVLAMEIDQSRNYKPTEMESSSERQYSEESNFSFASDTTVVSVSSVREVKTPTTEEEGKSVVQEGDKASGSRATVPLIKSESNEMKNQLLIATAPSSVASNQIECKEAETKYFSYAAAVQKNKQPLSTSVVEVEEEKIRPTLGEETRQESPQPKSQVGSVKKLQNPETSKPTIAQREQNKSLLQFVPIDDSNILHLPEYNEAETAYQLYLALLERKRGENISVQVKSNQSVNQKQPSKKNEPVEKVRSENVPRLDTKEKEPTTLAEAAQQLTKKVQELTKNITELATETEPISSKITTTTSGQKKSDSKLPKGPTTNKPSASATSPVVASQPSPGLELRDEAEQSLLSLMTVYNDAETAWREVDEKKRRRASNEESSKDTSKKDQSGPTGGNSNNKEPKNKEPPKSDDGGSGSGGKGGPITELLKSGRSALNWMDWSTHLSSEVPAAGNVKIPPSKSTDSQQSKTAPTSLSSSADYLRKIKVPFKR